MFKMCRFSICLLSIFSFSTLLSAQEQRDVDGPSMSPVITAATAGEKVRFSSAASVAQIRVQILSAIGDSLFDSAWKDGNVFDWPIEPLVAGSYRCVVMVKDLDGRVTRKEAGLTTEGGNVSFESRSGSDRLTIMGSGPKITMLAHDEKNGAIINTSGDLSFRVGEFFRGKDSERMRLTAEGSLGIGTDKPQAPLDVNGLIRTSKGIMFPDGTILTTAGGEAAAGQSGGVNRPNPRLIGGVAPGSWASTNPGRLPTRPDAAITAYQFVVDAAGVHIGTTNAFGLSVAGQVSLLSNLSLPPTAPSGAAGVITFGGSRFAHAIGTANTFLGLNAGNFTMTGGNNTADGDSTLQANTSGTQNTAIGSGSLYSNTTGSNNTATGALALQSNNGSGNTASGEGALQDNIFGSSNTAYGAGALQYNNTGSGNIAIGVIAGQNIFNADNNIDIGHAGVSGDAATIRIGTAAAQTRAFLAGVRGVTTGMMDGLTVMIDSAGQLGTVNSSARVKKDISDISEQSSALMKLRPVSFFYRNDAVGMRQYGLIAEEVAGVMPELVQFSPTGEAETVRYHFLAPLLLDQVQKQHRKIEEQDRRIEKQNATIDALQTTLDVLGHRLQALERQIALRTN
jgi:hypothetical protein